MVTFYRGPQVLITDEVFKTWEPLNRQFKINDLYEAHVLIVRAWWPGPRNYELRATYRGYLVRLFWTSDARTFGQVRRGLVRAFETRRDRHERAAVSRSLSLRV